MDSSCYIKLRAFLHGLRLAKRSVPLILQLELQMSAVFNKREWMGSAWKTELVSPTKWWPDICFLQLHCRGTYLHSAPNIYTDRDQKGLGYHSNTYFPTSYDRNQWRLAFRILLRLNKDELPRALHIFIPFNSSDAISDTSVSFPGFSSLALHISFVMQPLIAYFTRLVPLLSVFYLWGYQRKLRAVGEEQAQSGLLYTMSDLCSVLLSLQPAQLHPSCNRKELMPKEQKGDVY